MARNSYGEGTIRKRKDGYWEAIYRNPNYNNGKRKSVYGKSEQEAKRKLRELKKIALQNTQQNIVIMSFSDYLNRWLNNVKKNELKPSSYDRLEYTINNQVIPHVGNLQLGNLTTMDIQELINQLVDELVKVGPDFTVKTTLKNAVYALCISMYAFLGLVHWRLLQFF